MANNNKNNNMASYLLVVLGIELKACLLGSIFGMKETF
jgi:hypothetical protein